jgi:hypothetical protein
MATDTTPEFARKAHAMMGGGLALLAAAAFVLTGSVGVADAAALRAPVLEAPAQGQQVQRTPVLKWKRLARAKVYQVAVSADRAFASIVTGQPVATQNTATTISAKFADGDYYWRVRAIGIDNRAGKWSRIRQFTKRWSDAANLLEPGDAFNVAWPSSPLILKWTPVPYAVGYQVIVASDPSLAHPVIGSVQAPQQTNGTVFSLAGGLPSGRYYWAIRPIDADGFKGALSRVGTFVFHWPSTASLRWEDIDPNADSTDPVLHWDLIPGAAKYEVEANLAADFVPGSVVWRTTTSAPTATPTVPLLNNVYYWRVRAIDSRGNAGEWNASTFEKKFLPTVQNVRVRTPDNEGPVNPLTPTSTPIFTWDPVPRADSYVLHVAPYTPSGDSCTWNSPLAFSFKTPHTNWVPGPKGDMANKPDPTWPGVTRQSNPLFNGQRYCMRVLAQQGNNQSAWSERRGNFTYADHPINATSDACQYVPVFSSAYRTPAAGTSSARTPLLTWNPVPDADRYWVVIARNPAFTNVVEVGFADVSAYMPRQTLRDETTAYYWAVMATKNATGCIDTTDANNFSYQYFHKSSRPPEPFAPAPGRDVNDMPVFRWTEADTAASYRLQIDDNATFATPLEDVTTASTAYATIRSYPVDTELYWRVRAMDVTGVELAWSPASTFRRRLPVPSLASDNPTGGETIPLLRWNLVPGAVSYTLHVDQADGTARDFTQSSAAFTPTVFYGTGIWRWKVRANFPAVAGTAASGAYSDPIEYVRRINAPTRPKMQFANGRVLFTWEPDPAATRYRLEVSPSNSFSDAVESVTTTQTAYAPPLTGSTYASGGRLHWRLANVDSGGNVGAFALGSLKLPKALVVSVQGALVSRQRGPLTVTVKDIRQRVVRRALVRVSGAGVRARRRTSRRGIASFTLRPRRRGTITVSVSRRGFREGTAGYYVP